MEGRGYTQGDGKLEVAGGVNITNVSAYFKRSDGSDLSLQAVIQEGRPIQVELELNIGKHGTGLGAE